jgi:pilus assembly protein Flp/PilA
MKGEFVEINWVDIVTFQINYGHVASTEGGPRANQILIKKGVYTMLFAPKEKGQGLVEYAIILALIAIVVIAVMTTLGNKVNNTMNTISNTLPS